MVEDGFGHEASLPRIHHRDLAREVGGVAGGEGVTVSESGGGDQAVEG